MAQQPEPAPASEPARARPAVPPAFPAPSSTATARTPASAPAPAADPLCSGPGWQQRRGAAALASLRRPGDALEFTVEFRSGRSGLLGTAYVHERRLEVFVRPCADLSTRLLRHVVAHELGHLVDADRLTAALRAEYKAVRGIPADTPWYGCGGCADFATPAGDFAEVYAQWQRGASTNRPQLAPAPSARHFEDLAARFFG